MAEELQKAQTRNVQRWPVGCFVRPFGLKVDAHDESLKTDGDT